MEMVEDYSDLSSDDEVQELRRRYQHAKKMREKARLNLLKDDFEADNSHLIRLAKSAAVGVSDICEATQSASKDRDRETMAYIDRILKNTEPAHSLYRRSRTTPLRYFKRVDSDCGTTCEKASVDHEKVEQPLPKYEPELTTDLLADINPLEAARQRMRRFEAHLDGILDYELPSADNFKQMRNSLREITDKMVKHKQLLDRHNGVTGDESEHNVTERVEEKFHELEERMPEIFRVDRRGRKHRGTSFDPVFIPGYSTGLGVSNSNQSAELRGRIRSLLCRTKRSDTDSASLANHAPMKPRQRTTIVTD